MVNCCNSWPHSYFEQNVHVLVKIAWVHLEGELASQLQARELERLKGISISNQHKTTILCDKNTGELLYNTIGEKTDGKNGPTANLGTQS